MLKKLCCLGPAILAGLSISLAATAHAYAAEKVGGAYGVVWWEGDRPNDPTAKPLTQEDWDHLAYLQDVCERIVKSQRPNALWEYGHDLFLGIVPNAIGIGLGAHAAFTGAKISDYAIYGGAAGGATGVVMGVNGRGHANKVDMSECMYFMVSWAQKYHGDLLGKAIIVNTHSVNMKAIPRPSLTDAEVEARRDQLDPPAPPPAHAVDQRKLPPADPGQEGDLPPPTP